MPKQIHQYQKCNWIKIWEGDATDSAMVDIQERLMIGSGPVAAELVDEDTAITVVGQSGPWQRFAICA